MFNKDTNDFLHVHENLIKDFPGTKSLYQPNKDRSYTVTRSELVPNGFVILECYSPYVRCK